MTSHYAVRFFSAARNCRIAGHTRALTWNAIEGGRSAVQHSYLIRYVYAGPEYGVGDHFPPFGCPSPCPEFFCSLVNPISPLLRIKYTNTPSRRGSNPTTAA